MKRINKILSLLLTMILLFLVPQPIAETEAFRPDWEYDNSFVVTVETPVEHSFVFEDFPELDDLADLVSMSKEKTETGYTYELVLVLNTPGEEAVLSAMAAVAENDYVTAVYRNYYYYECASKSAQIQFAQNPLPVPLGKTVRVGIASVTVTGFDGLRGFGIDFTVDPTVIDDSYITEGGLDDFGIGRFRPYESSFAKKEINNILFYGQMSDQANNLLDDETLLYKKSETNNYFGKGGSQTDRFDTDYIASWPIGYAGALDILTRTPGIVSAQVVGGFYPSGAQYYEDWSVENQKAAIVNIEGEKLSMGRTPINCTAEIQGLSVGTDRIRVDRFSGYNVTGYCDITVYLPGDVNQNGKADAADALQVLKHTVGKITLDEDTVAYHAANCQQNDTVDTGDALAILRIVVS